MQEIVCYIKYCMQIISHRLVNQWKIYEESSGKATMKSKELKINTSKTKLMASGIKEETLRSKADLCGMCGKRVMADSKCAPNIDAGFTENA